MNGAVQVERVKEEKHYYHLVINILLVHVCSIAMKLDVIALCFPFISDVLIVCLL
jgi:hypothetical protein